MQRLSEALKIDIGLVSQTLNNTNATGPYYSMAGFHRALAIVNAGAAADTKVTTIELLQATSSAGAGAKGIPTTVGQTATATVTATADVTEATITPDADVTGSTVTINGHTYTGAAATTAASGEYKQTVAVDTGAGIAACVNHATMGVPGVTASADGGTGVVTLTSTDPGATTITITFTGAAGMVCAATKHQAYVEIDDMDLDHAGGFKYIACRVTTTGNTPCSAVLLRGVAREAIAQAVGASAAI